jgi:hypothetical protein
MHVSYVGNSAQLYEGHRLLEDNFNNFDVWPMGLHRLDLPVGGKELNLSIKPIPSNYKIIFDRVPKHEDLEKASVKELKIIPEYKVIIE